MKKILLVTAVILLLIGGVYFLNKKEDSLPGTKDDDSIVAPSSPTTQSLSAAPVTYKDGSYTSDTVQTDRGFGPLQIKLVVSGGKITDVQFLQFPNKPGHTIEVSNAALPLLKQEAITIQSAQVDIVSGATQTSEAFQQVLSSTLAMAK